MRHRLNQGLAQSRNTAFVLARSDYVFVLDADSGIYPHAIAQLFEALKVSRQAGAYSQLEQSSTITSARQRVYLGGNVVQGARYQPFIIEQRNYDRDQRFCPSIADMPELFACLSRRRTLRQACSMMGHDLRPAPADAYPGTS